MSDICKNCGKPINKHLFFYQSGFQNKYLCNLGTNTTQFEPLTPTFTDDGEIKGEVFEGFEIDAHVKYPNMWLNIDKAIKGGDDLHDMEFLSIRFYDCAINYLETKYATQIEAFGERKRKEAEG